MRKKKIKQVRLKDEIHGMVLEIKGLRKNAAPHSVFTIESVVAEVIINAYKREFNPAHTPR